MNIYVNRIKRAALPIWIIRVNQIRHTGFPDKTRSNLDYTHKPDKTRSVSRTSAGFLDNTRSNLDYTHKPDKTHSASSALPISIAQKLLNTFNLDKTRNNSIFLIIHAPHIFSLK